MSILIHHSPETPCIVPDNWTDKNLWQIHQSFQLPVDTDYLYLQIYIYIILLYQNPLSPIFLLYHPIALD